MATTKTGRPIVSTFYSDFRGANAAKITRGKHAENMVLRCVHHMRHNEYGAVLAEVFDDSDGVLHAVIKRKINGDIEIIYQREVKD